MSHASPQALLPGILPRALHCSADSKLQRCCSVFKSSGAGTSRPFSMATAGETAAVGVAKGSRGYSVPLRLCPLPAGCSPHICKMLFSIIKIKKHFLWQKMSLKSALYRVFLAF
ncbi:MULTISPECIES: hypothetical protein [Neisseria]|uniref:hypothetical protein n=1 Tax=Neisseria TaxID=482 RepID=UPI001071E9AF|nr:MULTISPECIES: hypothetical protein [Neisseria]MBF0804112.1 hypothetical protein [Neisseria sp. 19428wB4_WF04]TFU43130.1 hypothetical protein E4T99_07040 [Neisseria sp. WF04]